MKDGNESAISVMALESQAKEKHRVICKAAARSNGRRQHRQRRPQRIPTATDQMDRYRFDSRNVLGTRWIFLIFSFLSDYFSKISTENSFSCPGYLRLNRNQSTWRWIDLGFMNPAFKNAVAALRIVLTY